MYSDNEYIAGVHRRDEEIFTAFIRAYVETLTRFAFGYSGVEEDAHDAVQEVFARIWELGDEWRPKGSVSAYLFTSVRHRMLNTIRAARSNQRMRQAWEVVARQTQNEADFYSDSSLSVHVDRAFERLTDRQREALRLRYEQDLSVAEVSATLAIGVRATERLLARALMLMRTFLAELPDD